MRNILLILCTIIFINCSGHEDIFIPYDHPEISYSGRIDTLNSEAVQLFWSGTSIRLNFVGTSISALFEDDKGDNYYNVFVDGNLSFILRPETTKQFYELASDLKEGKHQVEIFKRTEWTRGTSSFYGFQINGSPRTLSKDQKKKRKIEFFGNSITAGYAIEDLTGGDSPDSTYTNNYLSYASLTARHFDADYHCTCRSGIGIMVSWHEMIMSEMYDMLDPNVSDSKWDFSLYKPDVVVINLFQNDSWLVNRPDYPEFKKRFGATAPSDSTLVNAYADFVRAVRQEYPDADIICALGNMDATQDGSIWPGYISTAVESLNDEKIHTHFMPYKNTPGHPRANEQEAMANSLIEFIEENVEW